ncbi:MAG: hypothetical protein MJY56_03235 [Bacteroidales bacterium]|nr:hypothetical protein [Bacteroidales bacterium]
MKKILIAAFAATLCLMSVSCGNNAGKSANKGTGSEALDELVKEIEDSSKDGGIVGYTGDAGAALEKLDDKNYVSVIKQVFGVDVAPQSGWTVYSAKSPNKVNNADVIYSNEGEVDSESITRSFVEQILSIAEDGVYATDTDFNTLKITKGKKIETYEDYKSYACGENIYYVYGGKGIMASAYTRSSARSTIEYTFTLAAIN